MPRARRTPVVWASIALAAATAAGCADDGAEQSDYVERLNGAQERLLADVNELSSGAGSVSSPGQASEVTGDLIGTVRSSAAEIEAIVPPAEVADSHAELAAVLRELDRELRAARRELTSGNPNEIAAAATEISDAGARSEREADRAIERINAELAD